MLNNKLCSGELNEVAKAGTVAQMAGIMLDLFWEAPLEVGSMDYAGSDAGSDAGSELSLV